jgi:2'-5' RNA ligase
VVERVRAAEGDLVPGAAEAGARAPHGARWVGLENLHLTLRFLGATAEDRLPALEAALDDAVQGRGRFRVAIGGGGAFPSVQRPRAIWLGVADPEHGIASLAAALNEHLVRAGWDAENRAFTPHLTLARTDGVRSGPRLARRLVAEAAGLEAWFEVDRAVLFESHTGGGPARYEPLHEAHLTG